MALIPCPECQKDVSDKAAACPQCGMPFARPEKPAAWRRPAMIGSAVIAAAIGATATFMALRPPDYSRVEELRAEQDALGTHDEHVRQRFFRLYNEHPKNAMYAYLWARCVDDPQRQLDIAEQGIRADGRFAYNYNIASHALARLGRVAPAYEAADKGAALDPANMQLADKRAVLKAVLAHKLADQPKPLPNGYTSYESKEHMEKAAVRYRGLYHGAIRSPDRSDLQAIERSRVPDHKGPIAEALRGFVVCANSVGDACLRTFVATDPKLGNVWPAPGADVAALKDAQVVAVAGAVVTNGRGENIMIADSVTVEAP